MLRLQNLFGMLSLYRRMHISAEVGIVLFLVTGHLNPFIMPCINVSESNFNGESKPDSAQCTSPLTTCSLISMFINSRAIFNISPREHTISAFSADKVSQEKPLLYKTK